MKASFWSMVNDNIQCLFAVEQRPMTELSFTLSKFSAAHWTLKWQNISIGCVLSCRSNPQMTKIHFEYSFLHFLPARAPGGTAAGSDTFLSIMARCDSWRQRQLKENWSSDTFSPALYTGLQQLQKDKAAVALTTVIKWPSLTKPVKHGVIKLNLL